MALHSFGPAVDVQAGGGDLRFPHHAYQAGMAEVFTGVRPFARARLNVGVVRVAGAKMAKSAGNLVLVGDLLAGYPAAAVRLLILDRRGTRTGTTTGPGWTRPPPGWRRIAAAALSRPRHRGKRPRGRRRNPGGAGLRPRCARRAPHRRG